MLVQLYNVHVEQIFRGSEVFLFKMSCYKLHFNFTHCCLSTMNQTVKINFELRNVFEIINFTSHTHRVEKGKKLSKLKAWL